MQLVSVRFGSMQLGSLHFGSFDFGALQTGASRLWLSVVISYAICGCAGRLYTVCVLTIKFHF